MSTEPCVGGDGAFCMAFWMHFKRKPFCRWFKIVAVRSQQFFLFTNWCMLLEKKIMYTPQKLTWNLRRMISKRKLVSIFQLPSLLFWGYPHGEKKSSSSPGPSKRQIRHRSLLTGWPLTRVTTGPSWLYSKQPDSCWVFVWVREAFQNNANGFLKGFLKGHRFYILSLSSFSCNLEMSEQIYNVSPGIPWNKVGIITECTFFGVIEVDLPSTSIIPHRLLVQTPSHAWGSGPVLPSGVGLYLRHTVLGQSQASRTENDSIYISHIYIYIYMYTYIYMYMYVCM